MRTWINWCKSASLPKWQTRFGICMWKYCQHNNDILMQTISNRWHSIQKFNHMFFNDANKISEQYSILVNAHWWAIHLKWHSANKKLAKIFFSSVKNCFLSYFSQFWRVLDIKLCRSEYVRLTNNGFRHRFSSSTFLKPETFRNGLKCTKNFFDKKFKKHFVRF